MLPPKFGIGARVRYCKPGSGQPAMTGEFIVDRQLSADLDGHQYWIESRADGQRRVVRESEIARHQSEQNQLRIREPGDEESLFEERRIREPHPGER